MSAKPTSPTPPPATLRARLRNAAIAAIFALVLIIPKLLRLRHNPNAWLTFRIFLAISGAVLVLVPLSLSNSLFTAIAGLVMFLAAILLPSAKPVDQASEKARELETLVVVNGGEYQSATARSQAVQLFVGAENICVLDSQLRPLLTIPVAQITSAGATESQGRWIFRISFNDQIADFHYQGVFAEHFATVAESTIRSVMHPALSVLPQKRAARA